MRGELRHAGPPIPQPGRHTAAAAGLFCGFPTNVIDAMSYRPLRRA